MKYLYNHQRRSHLQLVTVKKLERLMQSQRNQMKNIFKPDDSLMPQFILALSILELALGDSWLTNKVMKNYGEKDFLRRGPMFSSEQDVAVSMLRLISIAEAVFNLKDVRNLDSVLSRLKTNPKEIEAIYTELKAAEALQRYGMEFKFNLSTTQGLENFDMWMLWDDGTWIPVETKCRIESGKYEEPTFFNTLDKAKRQLISEMPGIICVSIPETWVQSTSDIKEAIDRYFKNREKRKNIISIVLVQYIPSFFADPIAISAYGYSEVLNPYCVHNSSVPWGIENRRKIEPWRWIDFYQIYKSVYDHPGVDLF